MGQDAVAIYRSTDGGRRWFLVARTPSLVGSGVSLGGLTTDCDKNGIVFATPSDGWITEYCNAGSLGFFTTHDGGSSWTQQHLPVPSASRTVVACHRRRSSARPGSSPSVADRSSL